MRSIAVATGIQTLSGDTGGTVVSDGSGNILLTAGPGIYTLSEPGSNAVLIGRAEFAAGTVATTDATPTNVLSVDMGPFPGVLTIKGTVSAFDITDTAGAGYFFSGSYRTSGAAGTILGTKTEDSYVEAALNNASIALGVSGNSILIIVTGLAGKTIHWAAEFDYVLAI